MSIVLECAQNLMVKLHTADISILLYFKEYSNFKVWNQHSNLSQHICVLVLMNQYLRLLPVYHASEVTAIKHTYKVNSIDFRLVVLHHLIISNIRSEKYQINMDVLHNFGGQMTRFSRI